MKFDILNRFTGKVQVSAEIEADENTSHSVKLGLAVKWAYQCDADLGGAYLRDAHLGGAYLRGAYLRDADLGGADLRDADLRGANLRGAYLRGAYLRGANLGDAYLRGANLGDADLGGADLGDADLGGADLRGAKYGDGIPMEKPPLQVSGLTWPVLILDTHMQIGCELHSLAEWEAFDNERIASMDGAEARRFWKANKDWLLACARANGREFIEAKEAA